MSRFVALAAALLLPAAAHAHGPDAELGNFIVGLVAGVAATIAVGGAVVLLRRRYMPARM